MDPCLTIPGVPHLTGVKVAFLFVRLEDRCENFLHLKSNWHKTPGM